VQGVLILAYILTTPSSPASGVHQSRTHVLNLHVPIFPSLRVLFLFFSRIEAQSCHASSPVKRRTMSAHRLKLAVAERYRALPRWLSSVSSTSGAQHVIS
jgi:hypothetical protein